MDDRDATQTTEDGPPRRSYAWPMLWGPWACAVAGVAALGFGMVVNSPSAVRVSEITLGALLVVAGALMPRMQGPLELTATGLKGQVDPIPAAIALAERAVENVIPDDVPNRDERVQDAVGEAVTEMPVAERLALMGYPVIRTRPGYREVTITKQVTRRRPRRPKPPGEPPPNGSSERT
jgi:hypothetical protein